MVITPFHFHVFRYLPTGGDDWGWTPDRTPRSSRKVLGSIEKQLDKMRSMLTPRRKLQVDPGPSVVQSKVGTIL